MCEQECGHREMMCLWFCLGLFESVGGRVLWLRSDCTVFVWRVYTWERAHFFPQAVTRAAAGSLVTYPAPASVHEFLCLRVCLSFCLISTSCFILGLIQTQHSCAVSQRKRAWGMGCQVLVSTAMLYNCDQQMEGKWGYQLGLIFSLWARLTPHTNTIAHPLIWQ